MDFQQFDGEYIRRLRDGDPEVQQHFATYFGELLMLKLRGRIKPRDLFPEVIQETLTRALRAVRDGGVDSPERFGAFVHAICRNVIHEYSRSERPHESVHGLENEPMDPSIDLDKTLVTAERKRVVERILAEMKERDRGVLRAIYLDEKRPDEVCRLLDISPAYLRLVLYRARLRFRRNWLENAIPVM